VNVLSAEHCPRMKKSKAIFVVADVKDAGLRTKLLNEKATHGDLVILKDVMEGEHRYSTKRILLGFSYLYQHYNFSYLLKTDVSTFVLLPELMQYLSNIAPPHRVYLGTMNSLIMEDTNMHGEFQGRGNVNYMFSGGYVMSYDLVEYFGKNQHLMRYFDWEDVTVGAHLGFISDMNYVNNDYRFSSLHSHYWCSSEAFVTGKVPLEKIHAMYESYLATGSQCGFLDGGVS